MNEVERNEPQGIVTPSGVRITSDTCPACNAAPDQRIKTISSEFCMNCGHEYGGRNG